MSKKLIVIAVAIVGIAGILLAQQSYPNAEDPTVVLDNDQVVVQKFDMQPSEWVGVHSHDGNQLVVILEDSVLTYRVGDEETDVSYAAGDVLWIDAVEHDHIATTPGAAVIVTVK